MTAARRRRAARAASTTARSTMNSGMAETWGIVASTANILNVLRLVSMTLYPLKSLDGVDVTEATILPSGALAHDREYSMWDADGRIVNGKREARIHRLRSSYDSTRGILSLGAEDGTPPEGFHLPDEVRN